MPQKKHKPEEIVVSSGTGSPSSIPRNRPKLRRSRIQNSACASDRPETRLQHEDLEHQHGVHRRPAAP